MIARGYCAAMPPSARWRKRESAGPRRGRLELELAKAQKNEHNGRGGLDPVRYGDWEVKGIATDF